jgi:cysteine-rich repeat protein
VAPTEECDDGNAVSGDGCSALCRLERTVCGNGVLDFGEQCDDGNTINNDACNAFCKLTTNRQDYCGDGIVVQPERCDKGSICTSDPASCNRAPGTIGGACACEKGDANCPAPEGVDWPLACIWARCGDGKQNNWALAGNTPVNYDLFHEQCDDRNRSDGDGCNNVCLLENYALCGNAQIDPGEQCDDGNRIDTDGCNETCQAQDLVLCGDRQLHHTEECDDGNILAGDGCSTTCKREFSVQHCSNGIIDPDEECDDGDQMSGDGCSAECLLENGTCGDGVRQRLLGEQCEPVLHDRSLPYSCGKDCRFSSLFCGNGVLDPGEQCDEGEGNNDELADRCRTTCALPRCGDGIIDSAEQCDDRNALDGDGCSIVCVSERQAATSSVRTIDLPLQDLPGTVIPVTNHAPVGQTGPAAVIALAAGAAAGYSWMRRQRKK